jgi:hypothetical protein
VFSQKKIIKSASVLYSATQCGTLPSTTVKSKHLLDIKLVTNREHECVSNVIDHYTIEVLTTNVQIIRFHSKCNAAYSIASHLFGDNTR